MNADGAMPEPQVMVQDPFAPEAEKPRLYSPGQIGAAAILGTFVAGAFLYALNQRRLGQRGGALVSIAIGVAGTAMMIALGFVLPASSHGVQVVAHALGIGMWQLAKATQGEAYRANIAAGGRRASSWKVFGITLAVCVFVLVAGMASYFVGRPYGEHVAFDGNSVYYNGDVTEAQARALGRTLQAMGYFSHEHAVDVQLRHDTAGYEVALVYKVAQPPPAMRLALGHIAVLLGDLYAPTPLRLSLVSDFDEPLSLTFTAGGHVDRGKLRVYYLDGGTAAQAQGLLGVLGATTRYQGLVEKADVQRDGHELMVSFVVSTKAFDDEGTPDALVQIVQHLPADAFPQPPEAQVCDDAFKRCKPLP